MRDPRVVRALQVQQARQAPLRVQRAAREQMALPERMELQAAPARQGRRRSCRADGQRGNQRRRWVSARREPHTGSTGALGPAGPSGTLGTVIYYSASHAFTQSDCGNSPSATASLTFTFPATLAANCQIHIQSTSTTAMHIPCCFRGQPKSMALRAAFRALACAPAPCYLPR